MPFIGPFALTSGRLVLRFKILTRGHTDAYREIHTSSLTTGGRIDCSAFPVPIYSYFSCYQKSYKLNGTERRTDFLQTSTRNRRQGSGPMPLLRHPVCLSDYCSDNIFVNYQRRCSVMSDYYDTLITPEEAAQILGCGKNSIYKIPKSGKLKTIRIGRTWKIPKRAIQEYIITESKMNVFN